MKKYREYLTDGKLSVLIIVAILIIDQVIKIAVKTSMCLGESINITDWFYIDFIENNGMAYGMTFINKLFLSIMRLCAIGVIGWYIHQQVKLGSRTRYVVFLSMVVAGAAGNIIDSMFYGLIFNASSPYYISYFVPFGSGYADFLTGKVVDMFYFPIFETVLPSWVPIWGGQDFVFFRPIFNLADSAICVGVFVLLLFFRRTLSESLSKDTKEIEAHAE